MPTLPLLAVVLLAGGGEADPTRPGLVALDFRDEPVAAVVRALGARSGNAIQYQPWGNSEEGVARVTLEAPAPVPFWEAVDRLGAATGLRPQLFGGGFLGNSEAHVALSVDDGGKHGSEPTPGR